MVTTVQMFSDLLKTAITTPGGRHADGNVEREDRAQHFISLFVFRLWSKWWQVDVFAHICIVSLGIPTSVITIFTQ